MKESELEIAEKLWKNDKDKEAIDLLNSLELDNNGDINKLIGDIYFYAQKGISNITKNTKLAKKHYEKSLDLGNSDAGNELAEMYYFGDKGIKENQKLAEQYWLKSYNLKNELAGFNLANYYYEDKHNQIEKAIEIYKNLILKNEFKENCFLKLSRIYINGIGIKKNIRKGIEYLEKGIEINSSNCCMDLSYIYKKGEIVEKNISKAIELAEKAYSNSEFFKEEIYEYLETIKTKPNTVQN